MFSRVLLFRPGWYFCFRAQTRIWIFETPVDPTSVPNSAICQSWSVILSLIEKWINYLNFFLPFKIMIFNNSYVSTLHGGYRYYFGKFVQCWPGEIVERQHITLVSLGYIGFRLSFWHHYLSQLSIALSDGKLNLWKNIYI